MNDDAPDAAAVTADTTLGDNELEEECLDDEGLLIKGYDVVLYGTGLIQSILASALARAGKSILHCDSNDFYGEYDAVLSLGSITDWIEKDFQYKKSNQGENGDVDLQSLANGIIHLHPRGVYSSLRVHSTSDAQDDVLQINTQVASPYGVGTVNALPNKLGDQYSSLVVSLDNWVLANGKSPKAYFGCTNKMEFPSDKSMSNYFAQNHNVARLSTFQYQTYVLPQKRSFALDLTPSLVYANGDAVTYMIRSGVSEYCEFKSLLSLYILTQQDERPSTLLKGKLLSSSVAKTTALSPYTLTQVPCSKGDVFQTKLLSPLDKRKLMKFLQLASDYAVATSNSLSKPDEDIENDNDLSPTDIKEVAVLSLNERELQQGRSLSRPQNKVVATNDIEILQACIQEGLDFDRYLESKCTLQAKLRNIIVYAMAMCMDSSSYSTEEGMMDLCTHIKSLGRFGKTAFLVPLYGAGELSQAFCRSAAVHGGTYLLRRGISKVLIDIDHKNAIGIIMHGDDDDGPKEKQIPCKHVILSNDSLLTLNSSLPTTNRVFRRISILSGKLILNLDGDQYHDQRHLIVIPPGTAGNKHVIHCIAVDESVNVAPWNSSGDFNSTILHLTTIADDEDENQAHILSKMVNILIASHQHDTKPQIHELYQVSFSYNGNSASKENSYSDIAGLHFVSREGHDTTIEKAFHEAKRIFHQICPENEFLALSDDMNDIIKEKRMGRSEEDDDERVLESAMNMMDDKKDLD